jgi:hypothetical protein
LDRFLRSGSWLGDRFSNIFEMSVDGNLTGVDGISQAAERKDIAVVLTA